MGLLDSIHGLIERRVLLNFRIDPARVAAVLPQPFLPKLHNGYAIGGVCMIRFAHLRPRGVPRWLGMNSENAAHRIAVQWHQDGSLREGVYIPRRDTNSWFNRTLGGRLFPGLFNRSTFEVDESKDQLSIRIVRQNGEEEVAFKARHTDRMPAGSGFASLDEAARFFALGATGYSATYQPGHFHGMELFCRTWNIRPLSVDTARSRFFSNVNHFPPGSVVLDSALIMQNIDHEWRSRPDLFACEALTSTTDARSQSVSNTSSALG